MSEKGIIFSGPMVQAILDGRKTQTRRVFKVTDPLGKKHPVTSPRESIEQFDDGSFHYLSTGGMSGPYPCPYGQPGDGLWVREAWCHVDGQDYYRADFDQADLKHEKRVRKLCPDLAAAYPESRWKSSRHMPRWASRITLEITGIRVERVQDISEADAKAEGVEPITEMTAAWGPQQTPHWFAFMKLWDSLNDKRPGCSWNDNPWVWCISFKRIET